MDRLDLIERIKDLEQQLKEAHQILEAFKAGMKAQKIETEKVKNQLREATNTFGADE